MLSQYAYIVAACKKYIPEINGLLNSLDACGNKQDVHVWHYDWPTDYLQAVVETEWTFSLIMHKIEEPEARQFGGEAEIVCRKRYWYAAEIGKEYEAICVLDADLIFTRDPKQFMKIAAKTGFIVGTHKEQNKVYDHEHHLAQGKILVDPEFWNDKDLCNCPLFIDAKLHERPLKRSWEIFADGFPETNFRAPDMDAMNISFIEAGLYDSIIKLSNHAWLGTNESILKPYTRAVLRRDKLFTENGQEIFCFHGQYYKKKWRDCQISNRHGCAEGYLKASENSDNMARGSMDLLTSIFNKMCFEHKLSIEKKDYVHPELPYEGD